MRFRSLSVAACVVVALAGLAACGSSSKHSAATTTTAPSKTVAVQTTDGQVSLSLDGQLPPNWPTSFPVPDGAKPAGSGSLVNGGSGVLIGVYSTTTPPTDAFDSYKNDSSLTVTKSRSVGTGDKYVGTIGIGGPYAGNITIVPGGGGSYIVITLKSGSSTSATT